MSDAHQNNFLEPEPHIVARLQAALGDLQPKVQILTAAQLAGVKENAQHTPAVHVVWSGFRVRQTRTDGRQATLQHTWLIVAAVKNVQGARTGAAARADAGELAARAGAALMGFRPPNVAGPMLMAPAPAAGYSAGFMYLPLAFHVDSMFNAA